MQLSYLPSHGFRTLAGPGGALHIRGQCSLPDEALRAYLARGAFPEFLRGNFALVFEGVGETIAAVDHLSTYPLFLTAKHIGGDFVTVAETLGPIALDEAAATTLDVLGGHTFTGLTSVKGVQQLRACRYWRHGVETQFIDLESVGLDADPNLDEFRDVVEAVVRNGVKDRNALLLSAGTDSVTLAGITRKLGLTEAFKYVHIYSTSQHLTDRFHCQAVAQEMGLDVVYNEQRYTGKIHGEHYHRATVNWRDHGFAVKRAAMVESGCGQDRLLTGENGDQLFGGPKIEMLMKYVAQVDAPDPRLIGHLWLNRSTANPYTSGTNIAPKTQRWRKLRPGGEEAYANADLVGELFSRLAHLPYATRFQRMNLILKGPYRAYHYAQDDLDWWAPFADWEIVSRAMRLGATTTMPGGMSKGVMLQMWRDWVSPRPWLVGKSGIMIPSVERYRAKS